MHGKASSFPFCHVEQQMAMKRLVSFSRFIPLSVHFPLNRYKHLVSQLSNKLIVQLFSINKLPHNICRCSFLTFDISKIKGINPNASFGNRFRSKLRGIKPSAARDCSTYQFRYASLSELEFQQ
jgi:hypothetical protein